MSMDTAKEWGLFIYTTAVVAATVYGCGSGFTQWLTTPSTRVRISNKTLEPIVNVCISSGSLAFHVVTAGVGSMVVAATAPVSVPLIVWLDKEKN